MDEMKSMSMNALTIDELDIEEDYTFSNYSKPHWSIDKPNVQGAFPF